MMGPLTVNAVKQLLLDLVLNSLFLTMAYGKIKADTVIRDNSGSDEEITIALLVAKANLIVAFTGTFAATTELA